MATLNPTVNQDPSIRPEQPITQVVQGPNIGGALAGLAQTFIGTSSSSGPTFAQAQSMAEDDRQRGLDIGLQNGLADAAQLRAQGDFENAARLERQVIVNYRRAGGDITGQAYTDVVEQTTGRPSEWLGMTPEQVAIQEEMQTEGFRRNYLAAKVELGPEATEEDLIERALMQTGVEQRLENDIVSQTLQWKEGKRDSFMQAITHFQNTNIGAMQTMVEEGAFVTEQDFFSATSQWRQVKDALVRNKPPNLPEDEWEEVQQRIAFVDESFAQLEEYVGASGRELQLMSSILAAGDKLYRDGEITELQLLSLTKLPKADLLQLADANFIPVEDAAALGPILQSTISTMRDEADFGSRTGDRVPDPDDPNPELPFAPETMESARRFGSPERSRQAANDIVTTLGLPSLSQSPEGRSVVKDEYDKMFSILYIMGDENDRFISASDAAKFFGPKVVNNLKEIGKTNPSWAEESFRAGATALEAQEAVATAKFINFARQNGVLVEEGFNFTVNEQTMRDLGVDDRVTSRFVAAANEFYGGNVAELIKDQGSRLAGAEAWTDVRNLARGSLMSGMRSTVEQLEKMKKNAEFLLQKRMEFTGLADSYSPDAEVTGGAGDAEVEGSQGTDDLRAVAADAARANGIPEDIFMALIQQESSWRPDAQSGAGAIGLGQLMPGTARELGVDPNDPVQNLDGAARYLKQQFDRFGSWDLALAAYNAGPGRVQEAGGIPNIEETQNYVSSILGTTTYQPQPIDRSNYSFNSSMNPLVDSLEGASSMTRETAPTRMNWVLNGPFQQLQENFGSKITINDALAKEGTSRESETPGSRHFHGDALDLDISGMSDEEKMRLVQAALDAGFQGFGFGNGILHIDMGGARSWAYGNDTFAGMPVSELQNMVASGVKPAPEARFAEADGSYVPSTNRVEGEEPTMEFDPNEGRPTDFVAINQQAPAQSPTPRERPEEGESRPAEEQPTNRQTASQRATQELTERTKAMLQRNGIDPAGVRVFASEEAYQQAVENGEVNDGDFVAVGQEVFQHA